MSKSKPLITALNIDSVECIYNKHKLFFIKQIQNNFLTHQIFLFLNSINNKKINFTNNPYIKQIENVNKLLNIENCLFNMKDSLLKISNFLNLILFFITNFKHL